MAKFQTPRGTRDFLPQDMLRRNYIFGRVRNVFERFGFVPLETPAFEDWKLLAAKGGGGDEIKNEIYYFKDKSGRELGLRFDLTVPTARVVAGNPQLPMPFKRYQIGRVWRYDRPQAGRFREFWQADADIIGSDSMLADTECIAAAAQCLKELGFRDFEIRLNNRKVLNGMVQLAGVPEGKSQDVFRILDKIEKIGESEVMAGLEKIIGREKAGKILEMIGTKGGKGMLAGQKKLMGSIEIALEGIGELEEILKYARVYGILDRIVIDFSLVRGLDYYTGPIFEIVVKAKNNIGSVMGGGRYDKMIELYGGKPSPATGMSLGLERIFEIMSSEGMFKEIDKATARVFVAPARDEPKLREECVKLTGKLRGMGIPADTDFMGRKLKKIFEYVDSAGIPFMIILGEKELKSGKLTLRDMGKRQEKRLVFEKAAKLVGSS